MGSWLRYFIHATISLDGFMADNDGSIEWMEGFASTPEDEALMRSVWEELGAVVGGANKTQTIEDGEEPYGGMLGVPVWEMTHTATDPVAKDGVTYTFVVDDIAQAVGAAKAAAGDKSVALLGGSIARQCLALGLVDEIVLIIVPVLLGDGISLFAGLGETVHLERVDTSAWADGTHLRFRVVK